MTRMRTGRDQPEITCQNLGCYHATRNRLNQRHEVKGFLRAGRISAFPCEPLGPLC
jgi:hypothetical protein